LGQRLGCSSSDAEQAPALLRAWQSPFSDFQQAPEGVAVKHWSLIFPESKVGARHAVPLHRYTAYECGEAGLLKIDSVA